MSYAYFPGNPSHGLINYWLFPGYRAHLEFLEPLICAFLYLRRIFIFFMTHFYI